MPQQPEDAPRARIRWWFLLIAVAFLAVAVFGGIRIYAAQRDAAAPDPAEATQEAEVPVEPAESIDGAWVLAEGSEAGYRVEEVLGGEDVTVVGRTEAVTGELEVSGGSVTDGEVVIDLREVRTDSAQRDEYFATRAVDTSEHPEAGFVLTGPVDLADLAESTGIMQVAAQGVLSINGVENDAEVVLDVVREQDRLTVAGAVPAVWADFDVQAPDLGFVSVEDEGALELSLVFERA
ncbi:YceI family protein [Sediminivirga luteola]|uniref:YceI family protein n=1 Tax=Sediminivirga luteola TaxID=1774748 RepID=UPI001F5651B7|nr:YceI family protein [Sediminivirga luteola]